jgi:hypothetical protein
MVPAFLTALKFARQITAYITVISTVIGTSPRSRSQHFVQVQSYNALWLQLHISAAFVLRTVTYNKKDFRLLRRRV